MPITRISEATWTKFYKYELTGKMESWGRGLNLTDPASRKLYVLRDDIGYLYAEDGFDPTKYANSTLTLTEITDATELAAAKTALGFS